MRAAITFRALQADEIGPSLLSGFIRRQVVGKCWRKVEGCWRVLDRPFVDDWTAQDRLALLAELRATAQAGGLVSAALLDGALKGFAAVEPAPLGPRGEYLALSQLHVSADMRHQGLGRLLFAEARLWAHKMGAEKLYISAHSAIETQAFYRAMGCVEAQYSDPAHVLREPCDCQLECALSRADG